MNEEKARIQARLARDRQILRRLENEREAGYSELSFAGNKRLDFDQIECSRLRNAYEVSKLTAKQNERIQKAQRNYCEKHNGNPFVSEAAEIWINKLKEQTEVWIKWTEGGLGSLSPNPESADGSSNLH